MKSDLKSMILRITHISGCGQYLNWIVTAGGVVRKELVIVISSRFKLAES